MIDKFTPPAQKTVQIWSAYILLLFFPAMFSANMIVAKAMADLFPPMSLAFWRWLLALLVLGACCWPSLVRFRHQILAEWFEFLILGALGMGVCGAFVYLGAMTTSATNIGIIYASAPIFIILMARAFFAEKLSYLQLFGVGVCLIGVVFILSQGKITTLFALEFVAGDLWIVGASCGWAGYSILQKYRPSKLPMLVRMCGITLGGVVCLLPFTVFEVSQQGWPTLSEKILLNMAILVFICSLGAYLIYYFVQTHIGASRAGLAMYLAPIYNTIMAWFILGETPLPFHYVGAAMILAGIFITSLPTPTKSSRALNP